MVSSAAQKNPKDNVYTWLVVYNLLSSSLWSFILFGTIFLTVILGQPYLFQLNGQKLIIIQCFAVFDIINAVLGFVRSPVFTTVIQVFSRLLIVLGICFLLPESPANTHWCYITLCLSWSITEVIRYAYYACSLYNLETIPAFLVWCRYSLFYVLYPSGVSSEIYMIILSLREAEIKIGTWYAWALKVILVIYIPGFYMLYTYMIRQRRKVLGREKKKV